jgi:hypothetical protein
MVLGRPAGRARSDGLARLTAGVAEVLDSGGDLDVVTARVAGVIEVALRDDDLLPLFAGRQKS